MKLFHIVVNNELKCKEELYFDGKDYFSCEYNSIKKKFTQIGVKVEANEVFVRQFEKNILSLTYDTLTGIWYQKSNDWIENDFMNKSHSIFGINVGGKFEIVALNQKYEEIEKVTVNITPGTMSIEEYQLMQQEVSYLFEMFSYDLTDDKFNRKNLLRRVQIPLFPLSTFSQLVEDTEILLSELCQKPEVELRQIVKKIHVKDVTKWTPTLIIDEALKKQGKVRALINEKCTDIRENRMVKFMLDEYLKRATNELKLEQQQRKMFELEASELLLMLSQTKGELTVQPRRLHKILKKDIQLLEMRNQKWHEIIKRIEIMLENQLMAVESELLEETYLFRMHAYYSELYDIYNQYEQLLPELTSTFRLFVENLLRSPTLYEVWVLLKIVQYLMQWGLNPKEFIRDLERKYSNLNTVNISGYRKRFHLPNRPFDIAIYYDYEFSKNKYRPDFVIGFKNKNISSGWSFHTLDVKYKDYSTMEVGRNVYMKDLERSAYRYLKELLRPKYVIQSATLVHLDRKSTNWNVKPDKLLPHYTYHKLAHFYLAPFDSNNLSIYFKRLLHEGSNYTNCCPQCGKVGKGEQKNYKVINIKDNFKKKKQVWKTHYTCDYCNELWVANFCSDCSFNNRNNLISECGSYVYPRPLYKYPTNNYNIQVSDEWEVHCPSCNKLSYPERSYTLVDDDFYGPNIKYHSKR
ncbi:hypothetical protein CH76_09935 [Lysinibacillus sp. BF-4]|uniref:nuclease domain-containing protein n=1 Tax=Lysinibacillus sp. BF-4 TaxID=1473546 RepID=UPI0005040E5F|nr:nuclease domain-containing protein [Lysinibacillus sp. BF-4]KFL42875.1 hypothetical protein CH76_09935 [Lysinibacillus sp. BF-4]